MRTLQDQININMIGENMLTFADTEQVVLLSEQQRQTLHQQQGFVVTQEWCFPLVEHLIQRSSLNLKQQEDAQRAVKRWIFLI